MQRTAAWFVLTALLTVGMLISQQRPAAACSCSEQPPLAMWVDDLVDSAESDEALFFIGDETAGHGEGPFTYRVDRVLGGTWDGPTLEAMSPETSCGGGSFADWGLLAVLAYINDGEWTISAGCGVPLPAAETLAVLDGLPEPNGTGPPAFVVGQRYAASHLAVIDARGDVLSFGTTQYSGDVQALAVCPGQKAVVAYLTPRGWDGTGDQPRPLFDVRTLPDLRPIREIESPAGPRASWQLPDMGSLQCLSPDGSDFAYLQHEPTHDRRDSDTLATDALVHLVRDGQDNVHRVGPARDLAVMLDGPLGYIVGGPQGQSLTTVDFTDGTTTTVDLPETFAGWTVDLAPSGIQVLARTEPIEPINAFWSEVDVLLYGNAGTLRSLAFPAGGAVGQTTRLESSLLAEIHGSTTGGVSVVRIHDDGRMITSEFGSDVMPLAIGAESSLVRIDRSRPAVVVVDHRSGEAIPYEGYGYPQASVALSPPAPERLSAAIESLPETAKVEVFPTTDRGLSETATELDDEAALGGSPTPTTSAVTDDAPATAAGEAAAGIAYEGGGGGLLTVSTTGLAAGTGVAAAGVALLWRRRR